MNRATMHHLGKRCLVPIARRVHSAIEVDHVARDLKRKTGPAAARVQLTAHREEAVTNGFGLESPPMPHSPYLPNFIGDGSRLFALLG